MKHALRFFSLTDIFQSRPLTLEVWIKTSIADFLTAA